MILLDSNNKMIFHWKGPCYIRKLNSSDKLLKSKIFVKETKIVTDGSTKEIATLVEISDSDWKGLFSVSGLDSEDKLLKSEMFVKETEIVTDESTTEIIILVDIAGSDNGFIVPITAAINMLDKVEAKIVLVGITTDIEAVLKKMHKKEYLTRFEILECSEYITNHDQPALSIRNKNTSNIVVACEYMKKYDNTVFVSASNTGALMAGGSQKLGRIKGIIRPALITLMPTLKGKQVVFLDAGANPETKEASLLQYAMLGEIYAKNLLGIENPSIGLLNIGEEEDKGTPTLKEAYKLLKNNFPNFIGNIEARYIFNDKADVIVCDGLEGNIALKTIEGTASALKNVISAQFKKNFFTKIIGLLIKPFLKAALKPFDYKEREGALLIGIIKGIFKVHGSASVVSYEKTILQAYTSVLTNMIQKIEQDVQNQKELRKQEELKIQEDVNKKED